MKSKDVYHRKNEKVIGMINDELCGKIIKELDGLRPKVYPYKKDKKKKRLRVIKNVG